MNVRTIRRLKVSCVCDGAIHDHPERRAELEADLRAEAEMQARADAELAAETDALLAAEAAEAEAEAAREAAAAAEAAVAGEDSMEPPISPKLTLAQQIAATRAKVAREQSAATVPDAAGLDATKATPVGILSSNKGSVAMPAVPAVLQAAVDAGRADEVYTLLSTAPPSLRNAPGFRELKKKLLADASAYASAASSAAKLSISGAPA